jgi:Vps16, C-terminal region
MGDWMELDRFAKSKKSPIGYEVRIDTDFMLVFPDELISMPQTILLVIVNYLDELSVRS